MTARIRVVKLIVQPVVVLDDGESLTELQVQPMTVAPADLATFPAWFMKEVAEQEAQLRADRGND